MTIGIITIIGPEFHAVCREFEISNDDPLRKNIDGDLYFKKTIFSNYFNGEIELVVTFQKKAGNISSAVSTTKFIERFRPDFLFLCGIAAGHKSNIKLGDIVISKIIGNNTTTLFQEGKHHPRYESTPLQSSVENNLFLFNININKWIESLDLVHNGHLNEKEYERMAEKNTVNLIPDIKDNIIVAADVLIRDSLYFEVLIKEINDKIRAADMESAGFVAACEQREPRIPWLVVRGISDYGDSQKGDSFHNRAASVAASWIGFFLRNGFDPKHYRDVVMVPIKTAQDVNIHDEISDTPPDTDVFSALKSISADINKMIRNENREA